jgi:hypothetical protein
MAFTPKDAIINNPNKIYFTHSTKTPQQKTSVKVDKLNSIYKEANKYSTA